MTFLPPPENYVSPDESELMEIQEELSLLNSNQLVLMREHLTEESAADVRAFVTTMPFSTKAEENVMQTTFIHLIKLIFAYRLKKLITWYLFSVSKNKIGIGDPCHWRCPDWGNIKCRI